MVLVGASGAPLVVLYPNWFTKVHFVGYEPTDTKIKFRFMPSFFVAFYQRVLGNGLWESDGAVWGSPGVSAFPVGVTVLLLFLQTYAMYILHVDCGRIPYIRG